MRRAVFAMVLTALPQLATAAVIATRNLPAGTIIAPEDLSWSDDVPGGMTDAQLAVGMQVRIAIYEGRPVVAGALKTPVLVERNQIVRIAFDSGALRIETEGRALSEGAAGDVIRVMNLTSRSTISARVAPDGTLLAISSQRNPQ